MSEVSWSNKYRPKSVSEVIGQPKIKRELETLNSVGKMPKAILLQGSSGVGKTTMAFLIAKMGKCSNLENGIPCDECTNCRNIDKLITENKNPIDSGVYIYNISKLNKSDDAEEIIENMSASRTFTQNKRFFILDEMQVASQQAQARFLKIAEEQPKGLYIILCTTNPEKLSEPLQNRFVNYKFNKPTSSEIIDRLSVICQSEGVNYTQSGLALIVKYSNRSVRKSINKLQELSAYGDISKENVNQHLDTISDDSYFNFLQAVRNNNISRISELYTDLENNSILFNDFIVGFGQYLTDLFDISNLIYPDIYTVEEIRKYKGFLDSISETELIAILSKTKDYYSIKTEDKFMFYSFATELMTLLNLAEPELTEEILVETVSPEVTVESSVIDKKYREISNEIIKDSQKDIEEEKEMFPDDLIGLFGNTEIDL